MAKDLSTNGATRAVAQELLEISGAEHWRHSIVSWPMSEGCRFSVVLGSGNPPIGGVAMPTVASRMMEILAAIGIPDTTSKTKEFPGWHMVPGVFLNLNYMTGRDPTDQTMRLVEEVAADQSKVKRIADYVLLAEAKIREHAGTVGMAMDYVRANPGHPQYQWIVPVGYRLIGRIQDADTYVEERLVQLRAENNISHTQLYEAFAAKLKGVPP